MGIHHDMARLFGELSQNLRGAPSSALMAGLLRQAVPHQMKVNLWFRLRGQQAQLTIQVLFWPNHVMCIHYCDLCGHDRLMWIGSWFRLLQCVEMHEKRFPFLFVPACYLLRRT